jgi:hypothetical protein
LAFLVANSALAVLKRMAEKKTPRKKGKKKDG